MAVPIQEITEVVVCLRNCDSFVHEWGTKHGYHLHWMDSNLPDLSTVWPFIAFLLKHFIIYPTKKLGKNRKSSFVTVPCTKILQIIPCKAFIIIKIQLIPRLQQLFIKISSHIHSEWMYYWNYAIKSAKICVLGRPKAFRLYKTFQFWFSTQKHCS